MDTEYIKDIKHLNMYKIGQKIIDKKNVRYEYLSNGHMQFEILKSLVMKLLNEEIDENTFIELKNKLT